MQIRTSNGTAEFNIAPVLNDCTYAPIYSGPTISDFTTAPGELHVNDVFIKGQSLEKTLSTIQDRLSILDNPNPEKLEKYAALKKAYEHYKMLEKLLNEE